MTWDADLSSSEVRQMLLDRFSQFGRHLQHTVMVINHKRDQLGGQQLVQVHLIHRSQNAPGEGLDHLHRSEGTHKRQTVWELLIKSTERWAEL